MKTLFKKCLKCGAIVKVINDCNCENCGITCCGEAMQELIPNNEDTLIEKHKPTYEVVEDEIFVKVNHPMDKDHHIEWISIEKDGFYSEMKLYPEQDASCRFKYLKGAKIYAYCNKHGLWMNEIN